MATSPPGREICPYCKKTFKRLKSHLPHCKMARGPDSSEVLFPSVKVCSSVMPELLKTEKKRKIKSTETAPKKDHKKSKLNLTRNRTTKSLEELEIAGTAPSNSLHASGDTQTEIKLITEKTHKTNGSGQRASVEVHAQPVKKVVSEMTLEKKSSKIRKSRSEMTSEGKESMPHLAIQPPIQSRKPTSESPSQTTKPFAKHRLSKEDVGKQTESSWPDSSTEDLQPIAHGITDRIELVIENHRVRVLRNKPRSSVQNISLNGAPISNSKTCQWPIKSFPGGEKIDSTDGQQVVTVTQNGNGKSALGLDLAGNVWSGKMGDGITTVKAHTLPGCSVGSCRKVSGVPLQLATGVKNIIDKNPSFLKREGGYPKGSHVYTNPKSEIYIEFAEVLEEKDGDKTSNCSLTSLEKGTPLPSRTIVSSEISLRPPSLHMIERTSAHGLLPPDRNVETHSLGLEFFPELYPNYLSLGLLSRRLPQWNVRIPGAQILILPSEGKQIPLAERCLMDVKLQDLPAWLATRDLSLQGMLRGTHRAWNGYYNKYINVKKGGMAGISMLLLGYCILSYAWSYEHISKASFLMLYQLSPQ
ncbi:hypothetical protein JD844_011334 [Phrynosoma platyrhinos]|uniref:ATP synthase membrane subunit f n=1 Tax=Phrynosoma platyrhinos TaxID=52577 RepID=A0ABQ7TIA0_PHRPL|nr:hypothetical protein JD844_011334 [Phrynosoma platyrhinos]